MNNRKLAVKRIFDFEIGHLIKSPCRDCATRYRFPRCIDACDVLDRLQTHMARGISCTRSYSDAEPFHLQLEDRRGK